MPEADTSSHLLPPHATSTTFTIHSVLPDGLHPLDFASGRTTPCTPTITTTSTMLPKAQTLKQAKAAYKTRNQSTLTEREKKQIERSVELERRVWRTREQEKRKAEAKAKREEKERRDREAAGGLGASMTSQRRCDRFGFVGSQMHLGAFFGGAGRAAVGGAAVTGPTGDGVAGDTDCFDGDLDDETLLDALQKGEHERFNSDQQSAAVEPQAAETARPTASKAPCKDGADNGSDLDFFWDSLDSSTQIARDIADEPKKTTDSRPAQNSRSPATSFGSEEFDLSVEDIEASQTKEAPKQNTDEDKKLMPPPMLPRKAPTTVKAVTKPSTLKRASPLPPLPARSPEASSAPTQLKRLIPPKAISKPCSAAKFGFTLAELESFVDDNLQLTQATPG